jgi:hypothetical protein
VKDGISGTTRKMEPTVDRQGLSGQIGAERGGGNHAHIHIPLSSYPFLDGESRGFDDEAVLPDGGSN